MSTMRYQDVPAKLDFAGDTWTDGNGPDSDMRVWYGTNTTKITVSQDPENSFAPKREVELLPHVSSIWADVDDEHRIEKMHISVEWVPGRNVSWYYVNGVYSHPPKLDNLTEAEYAEFENWSDQEQADFADPIAEGFFAAITERDDAPQLDATAPAFVPREEAPLATGWHPHPDDDRYEVFWSGFEWGEVRERQ